MQYLKLLTLPRRLSSSWALSVCLFVRNITQKVMNRFWWNFQELMILAPGIDDYILVMFQILERLWTLIMSKVKAEGFDCAATYKVM